MITAMSFVSSLSKCLYLKAQLEKRFTGERPANICSKYFKASLTASRCWKPFQIVFPTEKQVQMFLQKIFEATFANLGEEKNKYGLQLFIHLFSKVYGNKVQKLSFGTETLENEGTCIPFKIPWHRRLCICLSRP